MSRIASVEDFVKKRLANMGKTAAKLDANLIREGWKTLVKKMGIVKATRFVVAFERGEGDSVKEIKRFWRGKSLDEIYRTVKRARVTFKKALPATTRTTPPASLFRQSWMKHRVRVNAVTVGY